MTFTELKLCDLRDDDLREEHQILDSIRAQHQSAINAIKQHTYSIVLRSSGIRISRTLSSASEVLDLYLEWLLDEIKYRIKLADPSLTSLQLDETLSGFDRTVVPVPSSWPSGGIAKYLERFRMAGFPNPQVEPEAGCAASSIAWRLAVSNDPTTVNLKEKIVMVLDVGGANAVKFFKSRCTG